MRVAVCCAVTMPLVLSCLIASSDSGSVAGEGPSPGDHRANVPVTMRGTTWCLHVPSKHEGPVALRYVAEPQDVTLLDNGQSLPHSYADGTLTVDVTGVAGKDKGVVVAVTWTQNSWEEAILAFEKADRQNPPPKDVILFTGSSTARGWDVAKYFPEFVTLNRGFGGSQYADLVYYADRVIFPYAPKAIVLYSGDNDVASGKSPEWIFADFEALIRLVRHTMPDVPIIVLGIKPSIARWDKWNTMKAANALMAAYAEGDPKLTFIDGSKPLLGADGKPIPEMYGQDGLHFSPKGYEAWTALVKPLLD